MPASVQGSPFSSTLEQFASESASSIVRQSGEMVSYLLELDRSLPAKQDWRVISVKAFHKLAQGQRSSKELNRLYWLDMAENIHAYGVMGVWRGSELLRDSINLLNANEVIPPAVLSRSLCELACMMLIDSNTILATVKETEAVVGSLPKNSSFGLVIEDMERLLVKIIHGTRMGNPPEQLKQKNVLSYIQKVAKAPDQEELMPTYEFLCDVAHPNVVGNARFWADVRRNPNGTETVRMKRYNLTKMSREILERTLWTLGWSSAVIRNSYHLGEESAGILNRLWA